MRIYVSRGRIDNNRRVLGFGSIFSWIQHIYLLLALPIHLSLDFFGAIEKDICVIINYFLSSMIVYSFDSSNAEAMNFQGLMDTFWKYLDSMWQISYVTGLAKAIIVVTVLW